MTINKLRGSVADRRIDSHVIQEDDYPRSTMDHILAVRPEVQQVDVSQLSDYDKG
jgi:hypothetical protein